MMAADHFYSIHQVPRFLLGFSLLSLASLNGDAWISFLLITLSMLLIRSVEQGWIRVVRSLNLLRWFMVPILLLHLLFTPGELLVPGSFIPISYEGLQIGLQLSMQLAAIFFTASVLFLSLKRSEWVKMALSSPLINRQNLMIYFMMIVPLKNSVSKQLQYLQQQWTMRRCWRSLPQLLLASFRAVFSVAHEQTDQLWIRWPEMGGADEASSSARDDCTTYAVLNWFCAAIGVTLLGVAWMNWL